MGASPRSGSRRGRPASGLRLIKTWPTKRPGTATGLQSWRTARKSKTRYGAFQSEQMGQRLELSPLVIIEAHHQRVSGGLEPLDIHLAHVHRGGLRAIPLLFHFCATRPPQRANTAPARA